MRRAVGRIRRHLSIPSLPFIGNHPQGPRYRFGNGSLARSDSGFASFDDMLALTEHLIRPIGRHWPLRRSFGISLRGATRTFPRSLRLRHQRSLHESVAPFEQQEASCSEKSVTSHRLHTTGGVDLENLGGLCSARSDAIGVAEPRIACGLGVMGLRKCRDRPDESDERCGLSRCRRGGMLRPSERPQAQPSASTSSGAPAPALQSQS
jgi:hypothetical protein